MVISSHQVSGNVNADDLPCTELIDNNTITYTRTGTAQTMSFVTYVVEFTDSTDVVHGSIRMVAGETDVSTTICSVDPDSAVLINPSNFNRAGTNCYTTTDDMGYAWGTLEFTNGTTVRARRPTSGAAVVFPFQAVDFSSNVPTRCGATEPGASTPRTNTGGLCSSVLPVELLDFWVADVDQTVVNLAWITATEVNNDYFEVLRSTDYMQWESIGIVSGQGTTSSESTYSFVDEKPLPFAYYRLKQVDFDGSENLHFVVSADLFTADENDALVYPNPSNQELVNVQLNHNHSMVRLIVEDINGKVLLDKKEMNNVTTFSTNGFAPGVYYLSIYDGQVEHRKKLMVL